MEVIVERCAFLDVHRDTVVACARMPDGGGGRREEVDRVRFDDLAVVGPLGLARRRGDVTLVGMEATGVYWKPVHWVLEDAIGEVWVINARHMRNVPGRKTDVADAQWGAQLLEHGLVRPVVHSAAADPRATGPDSLPQVGDRGTWPGGATAP